MQWWLNFTYYITDVAFTIISMPTGSIPFSNVVTQIVKYAEIANYYLPIRELYSIVPFLITVTVTGAVIKRITR